MQTTQQKKEMVRIVDNSKPFKSHEEKQYLICISNGYGDFNWLIVKGRTEAYECIKEDIEEGIDFNESFILVEGCKLEERKSIYAFMKYVGQFYEDNFDIDDYVKGDWSEAEYRKDNDIDQSLNINPADRISMEDYMNGDIYNQEV